MLGRPPGPEAIDMWGEGPEDDLLALDILPWLGGPPADWAGWPGWGILEFGGMLEYWGPGPEPGIP